MAITVSQIAHTIVGPRDHAVLALAVYEITAWNPYEDEQTGDPDTIDFSAAGSGADPTLRFRAIANAGPMVLTRAAGGDDAGIIVQLRRRAATTYGFIAMGTGGGAAQEFDEIDQGTDLTGYVSATPSPARFTVIGQPASDPVDTPLRTW